METTSENIIKAYNIARETGADSTCKVLEALYPDVDFNPKDNRPVTERIKTFNDACEALGEEHRLVQAYRAVEGMTALGSDLYAYLKLRIITAALNEGWEPQFTEDEWRYYPWFYLWSAEELANKDEEWKRDHCLRSCENHRVLFGGDADSGAAAGFAFAHSLNAPSATGATVGSRLCYKSEELAVYSGKQFIDIWMDFNLLRK